MNKINNNDIKLEIENHEYKLINQPDYVFTSVTTFINSFFEPFDEIKVSNHLVNNVPKYFGETPESLMKQWDVARQYGTDVHLEIETWIKEGVVPKDIKSIAATKWIRGYVSRPNIDTFSEVIVYSKELGIAGTIDVLMMNKNSNEYVLTFGIVFILVGLAFKISAVPFHMWAPDVYEGSPTSVTLFFTMVPKIAALTVFIRFLYVPFLNLIDQWQMIIIFLSIASMLFGAIAAIGQTNIKRLVAYSSIGHIGYTLAGLATGSNEGIQSSIIYISIYVIMNLALFSCLLMLKRNDQYYEDIDDLSGLSKNHPLLSLSLLVILFSLAGIPPLAGFFAKFYIFKAVIEQSMYFLAIVGLLSTVIAAFYYLRIIKIIYFDKEKEKYDEDHSLWLKFSLTFSTILILLYFIFPSQLIDVVSRINII